MKIIFFKYALKNILRNKSRNILSGISIALGTTAMIMGFALTDGIVRQTIMGFTGTLIEDIAIEPDGKIFKNYEQVEQIVSNIKGIDYVTKKINFGGTLFSDRSSQNAMVVGMEPEGIRRKSNLQIEKGRYLIEKDRFSLIISKKLSARLKVDVDDKVAIVVNMTDGGTNALDFRIKGIFTTKTGLQFVDHLVYISLRDTQELMGLTHNEIYSLGVYLSDVDAVDHFEKIIGENILIKNKFIKVLSWKKLIKGLLDQYYFIKYIILIFIFILIFIICVGLTNTIFLSISERTREIGTLMAMGAKKKTIIFLFMVEGSILSFFSSLFGSFLGCSLYLVLKKLPMEFSSKGAVLLLGGKQLYLYLSYYTVLFCFLFVFFISAVSILFPVLKASCLEPTKALGHT